MQGREFPGRAGDIRWREAELLGVTLIDKLPGQLSLEPDAMLQALAVEIDGGRVTAMPITRKPDRLGHLDRDLTSGA